MQRLKRIGVGSAFKIGFAVYALLFVIVGLFMLLMMLLGLGTVSEMSDIPGLGMGLVGLLIMYLFGIVFYGLIGGLFTALGAIIYNVVATWTGGLEIEIG